MDTATLLRYLESRATDSDVQAVNEWLVEGEASQAELAHLQTAWSLLNESPTPATDMNALWERIRQRLEESGELPPVVAPARPTASLSAYRERTARRRRMRFVVVAAAAAAVGVFAILPVGDWSAGNPAEGVPMVLYEAGPGQINRLTLSDGTKVVIGGGSVIRMPADYGREARELYLDGEAYFEVARKPASAFRVHTGRTTVENLGTRFTVMGFTEDGEDRVAVAEGSVAVRATDATESVILKANDMVTVSSTGPVTVNRDAVLGQYFDWMDGIARFEQVDLAHASKVIRRRFGVDVRIQGAELARREFTGSVQSATFYSDMRALAILLDAHYEREGRTITLTATSGTPR
jgi:transmembrane sensor